MSLWDAAMANASDFACFKVRVDGINNTVLKIFHYSFDARY